MNNVKFKVGEAVKVIPGAKLANGKNAAAWIFETKLFIREIKGDDAVLAKQTSGPISGTFKIADLVDWVDEPVADTNFEAYVIRTIAKTPVYVGASNSTKVIANYETNRLFTIIGEKDGFGKLKIGGWIELNKVVKR